MRPASVLTLADHVPPRDGADDEPSAVIMEQFLAYRYLRRLILAVRASSPPTFCPADHKPAKTP